MDQQNILLADSSKPGRPGPPVDPVLMRAN